MNLLHDVLNPPDPFQSVFGIVTIKPFADTRHRNIEIARVYTRIVADIRTLLSKIADEEYRTYLLSSFEVYDKYEDRELFEFTCVLCELRLSVKHYQYYLELETDSDIQKIVGKHNYDQMLRSAYRNTSYEVTEHDLEDCLTIHTNMVDHYNYFKNRLATADDTNAIVIEDSIIN